MLHLFWIGFVRFRICYMVERIYFEFFLGGCSKFFGCYIKFGLNRICEIVMSLEKVCSIFLQTW